jgi:uncharacterized membrane protein
VNDTLKKELKFIAIRSVFLNISAYLVSFFFIGVNISFLFSLIFGTAVMFIYLVMLYTSIEKTVDAGIKYAREKMMAGYLLRLLVIGIATVISFRVEIISTVGTLLPLFYPKMIYVGGAIFKRKGGV